jgi:hypothetical protein
MEKKICQAARLWTSNAVPIGKAAADDSISSAA